MDTCTIAIHMCAFTFDLSWSPAQGMEGDKGMRGEKGEQGSGGDMGIMVGLKRDT